MSPTVIWHLKIRQRRIPAEAETVRDPIAEAVSVARKLLDPDTGPAVVEAGELNQEDWKLELTVGTAGEKNRWAGSSNGLGSRASRWLALISSSSSLPVSATRASVCGGR